MSFEHTLPVECELPVPLDAVPDIRNWSENYCQQAYDPSSGFGFWFHLGLPVYDQGLWHDKTLVYLPGGEELLVSKGYTSRHCAMDSGPAGSALRGEYLQDSAEWVWHFHGAAHRVNRHELAGGLKPDSQVEPLRFELRYRGLAPVWDLSRQVRQQVWSVNGAHWEQPCTVTGWVEYAGQRHAIEGTGVRDHSRGARDFSSMGSHYWLHGQFPSGRAFGVIHVEPGNPHSDVLSHAYVVVDGRLAPAEVVSLPQDRTFSSPFEIRFTDARGVQRVIGELIHEMPMTLRYPNHLLFGHDRSQPGHLLYEGQIRWQWDGETGYGLGERTQRLSGGERGEPSFI